MLRRCRKSIYSKPAIPVDTTLIIEFNDRSHFKKKEDLSCLRSCTEIHAFMVLLCAVYGLRAGEVLGLRLDDIDWENNRISVWRSKARKRQSFALVATVGNAILRYLKEVRPRCDQQQLFLSLRAPIRPITRGALSSAVSDRMTALDIRAPRRGPRGLRHAFGCHLLDGKFSLKEIGDLMGHRRSATTRIYAKVDLPVLRHVALLELGGVI
jgi:integrase